jgi:phage-related minor tail protein
MSDRKINLEVAVDPNGVETGVNRAKRSLADLGATAKKSGTDASAGVDKINESVSKVGDKADEAARKVDRSTKSIINAIQRATAETQSFGKGASAKFEALANIRGVDQAWIKPYINDLKAAELAQQAYAKSSINAGLSAGQMANAMRQVPAQMTDIVTSLAGGQSAMLVFMQQGGQLRDSFGSASLAAKALGGAALGLINPLTVSAAALVAVGLAYNEGSKEADAFNKTLVMTGNAVGSSVSQLTAMAIRIDAITGTQRSASAALNAMASTGKVASRNLEEFSITALRMEDIVGQSVADTAKQFEELGKAPFEASKKLDQQYHYLSASTLDYIRVLQDQGKEEQAAALAQKSFSDAMKQRTDKLAGDLGTIESAWMKVKKEAADAIDVMLGIGRVKPVEVQLTSAQSNLEALQKKFDDRVSRGMATGDIKLKLDAARELVNTLTEINKLDKQGAAAAADRVRSDEAAKRFNDILYKGRSDAVKLEEEIKKIRADGLIAGKTEYEIQKAINVVRDEYAKKNPVKNDNSELANLKARLTAEKQYLEQLNLHGLVADKLNEGEKLALQYAEQLNGKLDAKTRAQKEAALVAAQSLGSTLKEIDAVKNMIKATDEAATARVKFNLTLADSVKKIEDDIKAQELRNARIGLGKEAIAELEAAELEHQATILDGLAIKEMDKNLDYERYDLYKAQANALRDLAEAKRIGGAREAAKEISDQWKKDFDRIEDWIGDAIARGVTKGKDIWKSLIDSLKASFARLVLSPIIQPIAAVAASVLNPGAAQASSFDGGSTLGTAANYLSAGKAIWQGFSTGLTGSIAGIVETVGYAMNSATLVNFAAGIKGATAAAGSTASAAVGAGNFASSAIPIVGWALTAAMAGKSFYESGYRASNNSLNFVGKYNPATQPHMVTDSFLQKLGLSEKAAAILSGSSGIVKLFGRRAPEVETYGINGTVTADGLAGGNQFYNMLEKGGVFRSDARYTKLDSYSPELWAGVDGALDAVISGAKSFASALGVSQDSLSSYNKFFAIQFHDDPEKTQASIDGLMNDVANDLAKIILPNIEEFSAAEESAAQTLQRLMGNYASIDAVLTSIGKTFGSVGTGSIAAREQLIAFAGGLEAFVSQTEFYAQNFLTEAERLAPIQKQVSETMASLGQSSVDTKEEFKALVNGLDLSSEAGQRLYAQLLAIAPAFATVANAAELANAAKKELANQSFDLDQQILALNDPEEGKRRLREKELAALDPTLRAQQLRIWALEDEKTALDAVRQNAADAFSGLQRAVDAERTRVTEAYQAAMDSIAEQINTVSGSVSKLSSLSSTLKSTVNSMRLDSQLGMDRAAASAQIQTALAIAKAGGVLPDADSLQQALSIVSQPNEQLYASFVDFQRNYLKDKSAIADLADLTDVQLSIEEQTLKALEDQKKLKEDLYKGEMSRLDGILTKAQEQLDVMNGIKTGVLSIPEALAQFAAAVKAVPAPAGGGSSGGGAVNTSNPNYSIIDSLYDSLLGRDPDAGGVDFWSDKLNAGESVWSVVEQIKNSDEYKSKIPGFATGGLHKGGLRIVGEEGPELELTGPSRIFNASQTAEILRGGPGGHTARLEALVERLTQEVTQLRRDNSAENVAIVRETRGSHLALDAVVNGQIELYTVVTDDVTPAKNRYVTIKETA